MAEQCHIGLGPSAWHRNPLPKYSTQIASAWMSPANSRPFLSPYAAITPSSARCPRSALISCVRYATIISRVLCRFADSSGIGRVILLLHRA
jgi:hypothetical protein